MVFFICRGALFGQALALQVRWFAFALGDRQARLSGAERKNVRLKELLIFNGLCDIINSPKIKNFMF